MRIRVLGTGTSQVTENSVSTSTYLYIAGTHMLLDCGAGTLVRMSQSGISFADLDMIFISHFHIDHVAELQSILWALKYPRLQRTKSLKLLGPPGFIGFYNTYIKPIVFSKPFDLFDIEVLEIKGRMEFDGFSVETHNTPHTDESISYKFIGDRTFVHSCDTGYDPALAEFAKGCDVMVLECSTDDGNPMESHLSPAQCGEIAKLAKPKRLLLTHLYPRDDENRLEETRKIFPHTELAHDLMDI